MNHGAIFIVPTQRRESRLQKHGEDNISFSFKVMFFQFINNIIYINFPSRSCFCAGGGYYVPTPCEDHKGWSLSASNSDDIINCDFISNSSKDPSQFCELVEDHMGTGEVKAKEAW